MLVSFVFLFFILWGISAVFSGDCVNKMGAKYLYTTHTCEKTDSTYCYFPKSGCPTCALFLHPIEEDPLSTLPNTKFHEEHGGCRLSIDYPQDKIRANFENEPNIRDFMYFCRAGSYFSTEMEITYGAYDKGNLISQTHEKLERKIPLDGYRLNGKIREYKSGVEGVNKYIYNSYNREIYTLRVIKAEITDDKCPPPKDILENKPISVATKLLLELKLNADDRIVYDDKETKKIEVNADQDEFYFGGRNA